MGKKNKNNKLKQKTFSLQAFQNMTSVGVKHESNASHTSNYQDKKVLKTTTSEVPEAANLSTKADTSWNESEGSELIEENNESKCSNSETTDSKNSDWSTSSNKRDRYKKHDRKHGDTSEKQVVCSWGPENPKKSPWQNFTKQDNNESKQKPENSTRSDTASFSKENYQSSSKYDSKHTRFDHSDSKRSNYRTDSEKTYYSSNKPQNNPRYNKNADFYKSQNKGSYDHDDDGNVGRDEEYDEFEKLFKEEKFEDKKKKITEKFGDLFEVSKEYSLAHCVAEDMNMGAGIALHFRREFKNVDELLNQRQRQGGCAYLDVKGRYIYYLITKRKSSGKPTSFTLWKSLCRMKCLIKEHGVKQLAMPTIGCGLDGLEWTKVKLMVEYVFRDYDIEILVCNFQQNEGAVSEKQYFLKKGKVVNVEYSLTAIESGTIILYFGSADGVITPLMEKLDEKFNFLRDYKNAAKRTVGEPIRSVLGTGYILYGCIVTENYNDEFDFKHFQKCLHKIHKLNEQDWYGYIAIEGDSYDLFISKIINLIRYTFHEIELYVCPSIKFGK